MRAAAHGEARSLLGFRALLSPDILAGQALPVVHHVLVGGESAEFRCYERSNVWLEPGHVLSDERMRQVHHTLELVLPSPNPLEAEVIEDWGEPSRDAVKLWFNRVFRWIAAGQLRPYLSVDEIVFTREPKDRMVQFGAVERLPLEAWNVERPAVGVLGLAVNKATAGCEIPEAYEMALLARRGAEHGDYRRAVLDSATIVEVLVRPALQSELERRLGALSARIVTRAIGQISVQLRLAKELGFDLPDGIEEHLLSPRNVAIHGNHLPSESQAHRAVDICHAALTVLQPLS